MKKYDIIATKTLAELVEAVNVMGDEWEPLGAPFTGFTEVGFVAQAMVKRPRPEMQSGRINVKTGEITSWTRNADCISEAAKRYVIKVKNAEELPKVVRG